MRLASSGDLIDAVAEGKTLYATCARTPLEPLPRAGPCALRFIVALAIAALYVHPRGALWLCWRHARRVPLPRWGFTSRGAAALAPEVDALRHAGLYARGGTLGTPLRGGVLPTERWSCAAPVLLASST